MQVALSEPFAILMFAGGADKGVGWGWVKICEPGANHPPETQMLGTRVGIRAVAQLVAKRGSNARGPGFDSGWGLRVVKKIFCIQKVTKR